MEPDYLIQAKDMVRVKYNELENLLKKHNFNWDEPEVIYAVYEHYQAKQSLKNAYQRYNSEVIN